ncbi:MAG: hypothetical protein ACREBD_19200 [Blastocatellia bacterium]
MKKLHFVHSISGIVFLACLTATQATFAQEGAAKPQDAKGASPDAIQSFSGEAGVDAIPRYESEVRQELHREDYAKLEKLAAELRASKARFPGGAWKLHKFYQGVSRPVSAGKVSEQEWVIHLPKLQKWLAQYPKSITARVALGGAYIEYAWSARGSGFADTVTEEGWRLFRERLALAEKTLNDARELPEKCPHWYATMETVARGQGWERARFEGLFEEAVAYEPQYHYFYTDKAAYLLPRWHGEPGEMEKFAEETAARLGGKSGSIVYYLIADHIEPLYRARMFSETRLSWPRIRQGFQDLEAEFGLNATHLNSYCRVAGWANDRKTVRETLNRIGDQWDPAVWGTEKNFNDFKAWANESPLKYLLLQYWMVPVIGGAVMALIAYRIIKRRVKADQDKLRRQPGIS